MFLWEWLEFPSAPCLAGGKKNFNDSSRLHVVEIARPWHASELVSFLVGLRTYQQPSISCPFPHIIFLLSFGIYFFCIKIQAERNYCCEFSYLVMYFCLLQIQIYYGTCRSIVKLIMLLDVINYFRVFCCIHCTEEEVVQTNIDLCGVSIVYCAQIFPRYVVDRSLINPLYSVKDPFRPMQMKMKFIRHVLMEISNITCRGNASSSPRCSLWTYILFRISN